MNPIERLVAIQELEQLKTKYWFALDRQDREMRHDQVWAPDAELDVAAETGYKVRPRNALIEWVKQQFVDQIPGEGPFYTQALLRPIAADVPEWPMR